MGGQARGWDILNIGHLSAENIYVYSLCKKYIVA